MAEAGEQAQRSLWASTILFARLLYWRVGEDQNSQRAAALAYNTLFSLLPTLVLALLVLSIISGPGIVHRRAPVTRPATTPASMSVDLMDQGNLPDAAAQPEAEASTLADQVRDWVLTQFGFEQITMTVIRDGKPEVVSLSEVIGRRIERVRELVQSPGTGLIALGVLIYGVVNLMMVIERAFGRIYRATTRRTWVRRFSLYTCLFVWSPMAVAGSIVVSQMFARAAGSALRDVAWFWPVMGVIVSLFISWAMLVILYKLIPETHVEWEAAMTGALVGAILWEAGKYAFGVYVKFSVGTRNWYGGIALVPLFMLWIYLTWNFVLLGLQVAYVDQNFGQLARRWRLAQSKRGVLTDLRWMLALAVLVHNKFRNGEAVTAEDGGQALGLSPEVVEAMLKALARAGIVHVVEGKSAYSLGRPAEVVGALELLSVARSLSPTVLDERGEPLAPAGAREITELERQWASKKTLAMLGEEWGG